VKIGAKLAISGDKGVLQYLNFKGGIFNGVTPVQLENDDNKDLSVALVLKFRFVMWEWVLTEVSPRILVM
jgi:hypothetical protein